MANPVNTGVAVGRLTRDPVSFENADGSRKVMITVAARQNWKGSDGTNGSDFIELEAFLPANRPGFGPYQYTRKGDLVAVMYSVRSSRFTDSTGKETFKNVHRIEQIQMLEGKQTTAARRAGTLGATVPAAAPMAVPAAEGIYVDEAGLDLGGDEF